MYVGKFFSDRCGCHRPHNDGFFSDWCSCHRPHKWCIIIENKNSKIQEAFDSLINSGTLPQEREKSASLMCGKVGWTWGGKTKQELCLTCIISFAFHFSGCNTVLFSMNWGGGRWTNKQGGLEPIAAMKLPSYSYAASTHVMCFEKHIPLLLAVRTHLTWCLRFTGPAQHRGLGLVHSWRNTQCWFWTTRRHSPDSTSSLESTGESVGKELWLLKLTTHMNPLKKLLFGFLILDSSLHYQVGISGTGPDSSSSWRQSLCNSGKKLSTTLWGFKPPSTQQRNPFFPLLFPGFVCLCVMCVFVCTCSFLQVCGYTCTGEYACIHVFT